MPNRCVVYGCDSTSKPKEGLFLFFLPYFGDDRPEAKRRRKIWVKFVDRKRKNFTPSRFSSVCSKHFKPDDFTIRFSLLPGNEKPMIPRLRRDEFGVCVYPSLQSTCDEHKETASASGRKRRKIMKAAVEDYNDREGAGSQETTSTYDSTTTEHPTEVTTDGVTEVETVHVEPTQPEPTTRTEETAPEPTQQTAKVNKSKTCRCCRKLRGQREMWKQRWRQMKIQQNDMKVQLQVAEKKVLELEHKIKAMRDERQSERTAEAPQSATCSYDCDDDEEEFEDEWESQCDSDDDSTYMTETESEEDEPELEPASQTEILDLNGTDLRTEPKHIVFLSKLLELFKFCHTCKADCPLVEARQVGTEVIISTLCRNEKCQNKETTWHSQPSMKFVSGQRGPAGNFHLSMAILFAGGSATKVFKIFDHMGMGCISLRSFFKHQKNHLFPIIHLHWKKYQSQLIERLKESNDSVSVAGDARHDSMGHNAKYGAYSILCCTVPQIIHFSLVQRNQAESSNAMEFVGFKNCMEFLLETCNLPITIFVSDRHTTISAHMNKVLTQITHYFDLWHLKKKIRKELTKLSKEKGGEGIKEWIRPCENHLYWCAQSTPSGNGELILAKFNSFLFHVINKHEGINNPLFNKCAHRQIRDRTWLEKGSAAHDKMTAALTKTSLMKGIKQASPLDQTSSLEGFHSVVNYFAPKMTCYSYVGMYCRHILSILHFNYNLDREVKCNSDGTEQLRISYPKFKNGEATVRNICITQNFDYIKELYETFVTTGKDDVKVAREELQEMTPDPMNSTLEKQPFAEAVQKRRDRQSMVVQEVPATAPAPGLEIHQPQNTVATERQPPKCRLCGHPMKNHKEVVDCPRNQQT